MRQQVNKSTSAFLVVTSTWKYPEKLVTRVDPILFSGSPSPWVTRVVADTSGCQFCDKSCFSKSIAIFGTAIAGFWRSWIRDERSITLNVQASEMERIILMGWFGPKSCISIYLFEIYTYLIRMSADNFPANTSSSVCASFAQLRSAQAPAPFSQEKKARPSCPWLHDQKGYPEESKRGQVRIRMQSHHCSPSVRR